MRRSVSRCAPRAEQLAFGFRWLDGTPVPAMSVSGMLAMKEQFPHLRNGRPWRQKDIDDLKILRGLAAEADAQS